MISDILYIFAYYVPFIHFPTFKISHKHLKIHNLAIYIVVYEYICYENFDLQIYFVISSFQQNTDTSHYVIPIKFLLINYIARAIKKNCHWRKPCYGSNNCLFLNFTMLWPKISLWRLNMRAKLFSLSIRLVGEVHALRFNVWPRNEISVYSFEFHLGSVSRARMSQTRV